MKRIKFLGLHFPSFRESACLKLNNMKLYLIQVIIILSFTSTAFSQYGMNLEYGLHLYDEPSASNKVIDYYSIGVSKAIGKGFSASVNYYFSDNYNYGSKRAYIFETTPTLTYTGIEDGGITKQGLELRVMRSIHDFYVEPFIRYQWSNIDSRIFWGIREGSTQDRTTYEYSKSYKTSHHMAGGVNLGYLYGITEKVKLGIIVRFEADYKRPFEIKSVDGYNVPLPIDHEEVQKIHNYQGPNAVKFNIDAGLRLQYLF